MSDLVVRVIENPVTVRVIVGQVLAGSGGGGVSDGDKGGIVVSSSGTVWTVKAGSITDLMLSSSAIALFAAASHTHSIAEVTGLQAALDGKSATGHTHIAANVTDFAIAARATDLTGYAAAGSRTALAAGDTILGAFNKIGKWLNDLGSVAFAAATAAGLAMLTAADAAAQTNLLNTFTSALKGLTPASGGGTTNFLRADGTWAAPGGGGTPGGASGEVQYNNGGAFAGAADVEIEGGQLRLPAIATPSAPAASGVKLFGRSVAGRILAAIIGPSGLDTSLQPFFGRNKIGMVLPPGNGTGINQISFNTTATGSATAANVSTTNLHTYMRRLEYLVTTPATTAVVGFRNAALQWSLGGPSAGTGGFHMVMRWGPATGVATATHRAFAGMRGSIAAPTDVNPSTLTNICGMGYDDSDTNIQFMYNDGSGTATKIDLGASFPKPNADRVAVYEIALFAPPGTTQSLSYEIRDLVSGAVATGTVTTDLPSTLQLLSPVVQMSVGGTSSVIGIAIMSLYIETDY